jgi:DNA-binding LytR/AlgR family response regulator
MNNGKIKCLITDDEPLALDVLANYIQSLDFLSLEHKCYNAIETLNYLKKNPVDLLFLDIQMPRLTGIELLRTLPQAPKVIFTTAFRDYAVEGYELNVLDYLLKPISFDRFLMAVNKFYQQPFKTDSITEEKEEKRDASIYVKYQKKMTQVRLQDILFIESLRDYVKIKTVNGDIVTHANISHVENKLPAELFIRIHRSFIVPIQKIQKFTSSSIEINSFELPIGRLYKPGVDKVLSAISSI